MEFLRISDRNESYGNRLSGSGEVAKFMSDVASIDRESIWVLHLDARLCLIDREMVALGTVDGAVVSPREVFRKAIIKSSKAIILVHNHPSGQPDPSPADDIITEKIKKSAECIGIDFLDHIIITPGGRHFSYADSRKL